MLPNSVLHKVQLENDNKHITGYYQNTRDLTKIFKVHLRVTLM